jgi:hypothetical protein
MGGDGWKFTRYFSNANLTALGYGSTHGLDPISDLRSERTLIPKNCGCPRLLIRALIFNQLCARFGPQWKLVGWRMKMDPGSSPG